MGVLVWLLKGDGNGEEKKRKKAMQESEMTQCQWPFLRDVFRAGGGLVCSCNFLGEGLPLDVVKGSPYVR
jgi:hypothetical protein